MRQFWNRIVSVGVVVIILYVVAIAFLALLSPLFLLLLPVAIYGYFEHRAFVKKYKAYLISIDGTKFFCYNNRKSSQEYIEKNIIPNLGPGVEIIFLNGKVPKSKYNKEYISHLLYSINDKKGFPYLLKVSGGQLKDKSLNNEFYNTKNQNKDLEILNRKIIAFFETAS